MKKLGILIIVVLLCAVGWAGATYVMGGKVESRYFSLLEQYGKWGPLTLTNQGYERGFLGSRAQTLLEITLPKTAEEPNGEPGTQTVQVLFEHDLHHGPLLFGADTGGRKSLATGLALIETRLVRLSPGDAELDKLFREVPELRQTIATVKVDFDGSSKSLLRIPPFEKQADDARITWGGLTSSAALSPGEGTLSGEMEMPAMAVHTADATMTWNGIRGRCDLAEVLPMLYVGSSRAEFDGMDLSVTGEDDKGPQEMRMKHAEIVTESSFEDGLVQGNQVATFDGLTVDGKDYGPLVIDADMKNLDGQALSEMQQQLQDVYRRAENFSPDQLAAEVMPVYSRFFNRMMAGKPEVNLKRVYVATPTGEAEGTFRLKLTGQPEAPLDSPAGLLPALQYIDAALDLTVDESLVRAILASQIENALRAAAEASPQVSFSDEEIAAMVEKQVGTQLEAWTAQNFIVRAGDKVKTSATFKKGELLVNGQPLSLAGG